MDDRVRPHPDPLLQERGSQTESFGFQPCYCRILLWSPSNCRACYEESAARWEGPRTRTRTMTVGERIRPHLGPLLQERGSQTESFGFQPCYCRILLWSP